MSHKRWGSFTPDEWDDDERRGPYEEENEGRSPILEEYVRERIQGPEYHRIRIGLKRLSHMLLKLKESWQYKNKQLTLMELENMLSWQHEIEKETEKIEDTTMRDYIYDQLDTIAAMRRHIVQEIRWDLECGKTSAGVNAEALQE